MRMGEIKSFGEQSRYWIGVVSASHVQRGVLGGFAQLCHGKAAPLRRMSKNDWLIYYSPRTELKKGEILQAFTAIGQVVDEVIYEYPMTDSFVPFRRNVRYKPCREVKIAHLLEKLSFTKGKRNWGYTFRFGHFEISREDFRIIADEMLSNMENIMK